MATVNPGCPENLCSNFTLVHVQLKGNNDMLHHVWTMENKPIFFYARTDLNTNLVIDWDLMLAHDKNQSIKFSAEPQYFAAVVISKVISSLNIFDFFFYLMHTSIFFSSLCIMIHMIQLS